MTNSPSIKRSASSQKNTGGWKMLIMVGSLAATIGGWGILAAGQVSNNAATPSTAFQPTNTSTQLNAQSSLRQVAPPAFQFNSIARTRSSR
jgi:hypothetical protein